MATLQAVELCGSERFMEKLTAQVHDERVRTMVALGQQSQREPRAKALIAELWKGPVFVRRLVLKSCLGSRDGAQVMARPRPRVSTGRAQFEQNVTTLMRSGLADMEARLAMQTLRRFAIGAALQEQANTGGSAAVGIVATGDEGFEFGLQAFVDGLKLRVAERARIAKAAKRAQA